MVALKFWIDADCRCSFKYFARVAGIEAAKLLELETHFLRGIDYELCVTAKQFSDCRMQIAEAALMLPRTVIFSQFFFVLLQSVLCVCKKSNALTRLRFFLNRAGC